MKIKLIASNPSGFAIVCIDRNELEAMGLQHQSLTMQNRATRLLLRTIFDVLHRFCGMKRSGNYVTVACRPLRQGGCRFYLEFTREPSGRLYEFAEADDLLDAIGQLQKRTECEMSEWQIDNSGGDYRIYIPAEKNISKHALAILSEYSL